MDRTVPMWAALVIWAGCLWLIDWCWEGWKRQQRRRDFLRRMQDEAHAQYAETLRGRQHKDLTHDGAALS